VLEDVTLFRATDPSRISGGSQAYGSVFEPGAALAACGLGVAAVFFISVLHPLLAVRDADGFAYIIGAHSLQQGYGYRDLIGEPLNHWPPGYSLILALWRDPLQAALAVNYVSYGGCVGLMYYLLRRSNWTWQAALGLSVGLGAGFLRLLSNNAHADTVTFALFLLALLFIQLPSNRRRWLPSIIWAISIPIKLIAMVFVPASACTDLWMERDKFFTVSQWITLFKRYFVGAICCVVGVSIILIFNKITLGVWLPSSYEDTTISSLIAGAKGFLVSIPREFLFSWHGTVLAPIPGAVSCTGLRWSPGREWYFVYGVMFLICAALLLLVRAYIPHVRLLGYGLLAMFIGLRPQAWTNLLWLGYGGISLIAGITNALTVNSLGVMDPRYAELARNVREAHLYDSTIATNSYHILDLNAYVPSVPVTKYDQAEPFAYFLWVKLPNYDPGTISVMPIGDPGPDWCQIANFPGGSLYKHCDTYRNEK
jgi:hypothetical protein